MQLQQTGHYRANFIALTALKAQLHSNAKEFPTTRITQNAMQHLLSVYRDDSNKHFYALAHFIQVLYTYACAGAGVACSDNNVLWHEGIDNHKLC